MKNNNLASKDFVHELSDEKLDEFRSMPLRNRLQWLEEANMFVNKAIDMENRARFDKRFEIFLLKRKKRG